MKITQEQQEYLDRLYLNEKTNNNKLVDFKNSTSATTKIFYSNTYSSNPYCEFDGYLDVYTFNNYDFHFQKSIMYEVKVRDIKYQEKKMLIIEMPKLIFLQNKAEESLYINFLGDECFIFDLKKMEKYISNQPECEMMLPKSRLDQTLVSKKIKYLSKEQAEKVLLDENIQYR